MGVWDRWLGADAECRECPGGVRACGRQRRISGIREMRGLAGAWCFSLEWRFFFGLHWQSMSAAPTETGSNDAGLARSHGFFAVVRSDFAVALLALLFFLLPIYRTGILEDSFITPKLALLQVVTVAVLAALLVRAIRGMLGRIPSGAVFLLLAGFLALNILSILYAGSPTMTVRACGYFASFLLLYLVCVLGLRSSRAIYAVFVAGIAAAVGTALWTIAEDALRNVGFDSVVARLPDWRGHLAAGLGNSGHIAGFIGLFMPAAILLYLASERFSKLLFACLMVLFAADVVTWSIGSTGATLISLGIWSVIAARSSIGGRLHWKRLVPLVLGGLGVVAFYFLPHPLNPHRPSLFTEAFGSQRWAEGGPTRLVIWETTWHMIKASPFLGIGAGNFTREYVQQIVPSVIADPHLRVYAGSFTNDAHNEYLQIWCETGILSLGLYVGMVLTFFSRVRKVFVTGGDFVGRLFLIAAGAGVTVFLLDSLMSFPIRLPAHFAALMFFLSVPESIAEGRQVESLQGKSRRFLNALSIFVLLVTGLAALGLHSRRVMAEFYLKRGRATAESDVAIMGSRALPVWMAMDEAFASATDSLARGDKAGMDKALEVTHKMARRRASIGEAEADFRKALEWDPNYSNASSRLSSLLLMRGDYAEAITALEQTRGELESPEIHERMGFAQYMLGDKRAAAREWKLRLDRQPQNAEYLKGLLRQTEQ